MEEGESNNRMENGKGKKSIRNGEERGWGEWRDKKGEHKK